VNAGSQSVEVQRLTLTVSGLNEDSGRALARLVAAGLAPALTRAEAGTGLDHLRVDVDGSSAGTVDELAARIIDRVGRVLASDRAFGPLGEESIL
jgi:hypothetical protein